MMQFHFVYDVDGLPMVENLATGQVIRIEVLEGGKWQPLETEAEYLRVLGIALGTA